MYIKNLLLRWQIVTYLGILLLIIGGCTGGQSDGGRNNRNIILGTPEVRGPQPVAPNTDVGISVSPRGAQPGTQMGYVWDDESGKGQILQGQGSTAITYRTPSEPGMYQIKLTVSADGQPLPPTVAFIEVGDEKTGSADVQAATNKLPPPGSTDTSPTQRPPEPAATQHAPPALGPGEAPLELDFEEFLFTQTGPLVGNTATVNGSTVTLDYDFGIAGKWFGGVFPVLEPDLVASYQILRIQVVGEANFDLKPHDQDMTRQFKKTEANTYEIPTQQIISRFGEMREITLAVTPKRNAPNSGTQTFTLSVLNP
ncbi:MAG: hypothetical protein ACE5Q6_01880 [Dehalococcoidia bacterium]